jgi:hypothetical protein
VDDAGETGPSNEEGEGNILHAQVDDDAFVDSCLDEILYIVDRNDGSGDSVGRATSYKLVSGQVMFLSGPVYTEGFWRACTHEKAYDNICKSQNDL